MLLITTILAARRSSEDDWVKFIFFGIVLLIWIGGAIISAINKRMEEAKRKQRYGRLPADVNQRAADTLQRSVPQPPPPPATSRKRRRGAAQPHAAVPFAPPPLPRVAVAEVVAEPVTAAPIAKAAAKPQPEAARVGRLIRRPESLRAAFILAEVLKPPPGLTGETAGQRQF